MVCVCPDVELAVGPVLYLDQVEAAVHQVLVLILLQTGLVFPLSKIEVGFPQHSAELGGLSGQR